MLPYNKDSPHIIGDAIAVMWWFIHKPIHKDLAFKQPGFNGKQEVFVVRGSFVVIPDSSSGILGRNTSQLDVVKSQVWCEVWWLNQVGEQKKQNLGS